MGAGETSAPPASIVVMGSVAYDSIKTPQRHVSRVLGGSASYFSFAASFFSSVGIVAVVGEDFREEDLELLRARGVDTGGIVQVPGETFFWEGEYHENMNMRTTLELRMGVFADFSPELSPDFRRAPFIFLANIDPEIHIRVLDQIQTPKLVAMDTMNHWITGKPDALRAVLARVDMLFINDEEATLLAGVDGVLKAARVIRSMGPGCVVIKRGEYGVIVFHEAGMFAAPAYPLETVHDPTGAGDSFAGAFIGHLASQTGAPSLRGGGQAGMTDPGFEALRTAAVYGSTVASFTCEDFSLRRLEQLTRPQIEERFEFFRELTRF